MKLVADASVLVAALVDVESAGVWARGLLAGGSIAAPDLLLIESVNALREIERIGRVGRQEAGAAAHDVRVSDSLPWDLREDPRPGDLTA